MQKTVLLLAALALLSACSSESPAGAPSESPRPPDVEKALVAAGENRAELEKVLAHYEAAGDPQKLEAARFLIANMPGHGYVVARLEDEEENEIPFDALEHESYKAARAVLEALEEEHGELEFKRKRFDTDLEHATADLLVENIDLAFRAWREKPWAKEITFEAFKEHILPYRGSNEPLDSFRPVCLGRYADLAAGLEDPADLKEAAKKIQKDVHGWVGFWDLYYLHPTDQGFSEMAASGKGRCEDISNMIGYALRANAIPSATDYTPYWADRDNNHAWEVVLDADGKGDARLGNRAAKVYRKTFSVQPESLGAVKTEEEKVPRWLAGKTYKDVTADYVPVSDVAVELTEPAPDGAKYAYLSVFNGGEWKAIQWSRIVDGHATFKAMGRNIAYLPSYYAEEEVVPAAPPLILTKEGEVRLLVPDAEARVEIEAAATVPETPDADTGVVIPRVKVKPGKTYELFVWDRGWVSVGTREAGEKPVEFDAAPAGGLYWLTAGGSRKLERIFTVEAGRPIWW